MAAKPLIDRIAGFGGAAQRCLATARLEVKLNLGSPAPWIIGLILGALGYLTARTQPDPSSFPISWDLNHRIGPLSGVLLLFFAASLAHRPVRYEVTELLDTKPVGSEEIILGRWLGMVAAIMVPLLLEFGAAMLGQRLHAKPPVQPLVYLTAFLHTLPAVLFFTTFAYCLVLLTRVLVLGAGLAGLLWFGLYSGQALYPPVFRIDLSQNAYVFLGLTGGALLGMLLGYQSRRRARGTLAARALGLILTLSLITTAVHASWLALAMPGKSTSVRAWKRLVAKHRDGRGPTPNFAWVDIHGKRVSLASFRGRPLLAVFIQPKDSGASTLLTRLSGLPKDLAEEEVGVLVVCLSEDLNDGRDLARHAGADVPMVTDWGRPNGGEFDPANPSSAMAWSLNVGATPLAVLLDDDGKVLKRGFALDETSWDATKLEIQKALAEL